MSVFRFRLYAAEMIAAVLLYTALLYARQGIEAWWQPQGLLRAAVMLLPVVGCAAIILAVFRFVRRLDEMQRRIHFEAVALAFAVITFGAMAWPFLSDAGMPPLPPFYIVPALSACWAVSLAVATWRHR